MIANIVFKIRKYFSDRSSSLLPYGRAFESVADLNRNDSYLYFHQTFHKTSPRWLKDHRSYFSIDQRSFGEDAFHQMWLQIFIRFRPVSVLEIGVYRGSTLSLFGLIAKHINLKSDLHGISPFTAVGDSVSTYISGLDYKSDVCINFDHFGLDKPILHDGLSNDPDMITVIESAQWDLIFIDGNHDEQVVRQDLLNAIANLAEGGVIVIDDSALYTDYSGYYFSTRGHPGPSCIADEFLVKGVLKEVLSCGHNRVFQLATHLLKEQIDSSSKKNVEQ